jgi:hypothetical protein
MTVISMVYGEGMGANGELSMIANNSIGNNY